MTDLVFIGGGAWAREIFDWYADDFGRSGDRVVGYLNDDGPSAFGTRASFLGKVDPAFVPSGAKLVLAVAEPQTKHKLSQRFADTSRFVTLIHSKSLVSSSARVGHGVVLSPFSVISADAQADDFVTVNAFSSIGHNASVGSYSTLSAYVDLTGGVKVGTLSFWGSGARAIPGVTIGDRSVVGAGSVVVRNVADDTTVYTMPARPLHTSAS